MENAKLRSILELHAKWLNNQVGGERADLTRADLTRAGFWAATGNGKEITTVQTPTYCINIIQPTSEEDTETYVQIGCERHTWEAWQSFDGGRINNMDSQALQWWGVWKPVLTNFIETLKTA